MKKFLGFLMFLIFTPTLKADLKTALNFEQAQDDVRIFLKDLHKAQTSYMAEYGSYTTQMDELTQKTGFKIPAHISALGNVRIIEASASTFTIRFYTRHSIFNNASTRYVLPVYQINQRGVLGGLTQWNTIAEVIAEIDQVLAGITLAQKSFFVDYSRHSTDWADLGVVIPPYFNSVGTFTLSRAIDETVYAEFKGTRFPLIGYSKTIKFLPNPSCPMGMIAVGVNADGTLKCSSSMSCPADKILIGRDPFDNSPICRNPANPQEPGKDKNRLWMPPAKL